MRKVCVLCYLLYWGNLHMKIVDMHIFFYRKYKDFNSTNGYIKSLQSQICQLTEVSNRLLPNLMSENIEI